MHYPAFEELGTAPDYLYIGASAFHALESLGWAWEKKKNTVRTMAPDARRTYDRNQRRNWAGRKADCVAMNHCGNCGHPVSRGRTVDHARNHKHAYHCLVCIQARVFRTWRFVSPTMKRKKKGKQQ